MQLALVNSERMRIPGLMRARTKRMWTVSIAAGLLALAAALAFIALRQKADLFYTPSKIAEMGIPAVGKRVKVGGFVEPGSLKYGEGARIDFRIIEGDDVINVSFVGIAPDLFREGSGAIATGHFRKDHTFEATQLLAKHDENYVPRELHGMDTPGS